MEVSDMCTCESPTTGDNVRMAPATPDKGAPARGKEVPSQ